MLTQTTGRPLGAWKSVLRCARQQQQQASSQRNMATATATVTATATKTTRPKSKQFPPVRALAADSVAPLPKPHIHTVKKARPFHPKIAFGIYPRVPSAREAVPAAMVSYHAQQIQRLDPKGLRTQLFSKSNSDSVKPGDVLQVTTKRGEPFSGVCISIRRAGVDTAICLRNHMTKVGVEMWYKIYSPNIVGIDIVWRRPKRARRARLTYLRKPKHDMGSVDHLVSAWRRTRNVFKSKGKAAAAAKGKSASVAGAKAGKK